MNKSRPNNGVTEFEALKLWNEYPDHWKDMWLNNAYCMKCKGTSLKPGYNVLMGSSGTYVLIEGNCAQCGGVATRTCDQLCTRPVNRLVKTTYEQVESGKRGWDFVSWPLHFICNESTYSARYIEL